MPRRSRLISESGIYHVVVKGQNYQSMFEEQKDFEKYLSILLEYKNECGFELFSFCLMSNHVHLLLRVNEVSLSDIFRRINTKYSVWFNMKYKRMGHLLQGRFFSEPVTDLKYLINCIHYIHFNPTNAGLEPYPGKYPWSSYHCYIENDDTLVNFDTIYEIISRDDFIEMHKSAPEVEYPDIHNLRKRLPDDVARDVMHKISGCANSTDFLKLPVEIRNDFIKQLKRNRLSANQIGRLTGLSKTMILRIINR